MNSCSRLLANPFQELSYEERLIVKQLGRPLPNLNITKVVKSGNRQYKRVFKTEYYVNNEWLCGCEVKNALFCFPCLLFGGEVPWTKSGVTDINHLATSVKKHAASATHIKNSLKLALFGTVNIAVNITNLQIMGKIINLCMYNIILTLKLQVILAVLVASACHSIMYLLPVK